MQGATYFFVKNFHHNRGLVVAADVWAFGNVNRASLVHVSTGTDKESDPKVWGNMQGCVVGVHCQTRGSIDPVWLQNQGNNFQRFCWLLEEV